MFLFVFPKVFSGDKFFVVIAENKQQAEQLIYDSLGVILLEDEWETIQKYELKDKHSPRIFYDIDDSAK